MPVYLKDDKGNTVKVDTRPPVVRPQTNLERRIAELEKKVAAIERQLDTKGKKQ